MSVEKDLKKELRMTQVRAAVLGTIKAAGVITMGMLVPKIASTFISIERKQSLQKVRGVLRRLADKGLIQIQANGIRLSPAGERLIDRYRAPQRPKKWDGKWRIVLFDVPERKRHSRTRLRHMLNEIGFVRLQDSAWIFPFDCEELVSLLKIDFQLGSEVHYIVAAKIANDAFLRQHFGLTQ